MRITLAGIVYLVVSILILVYSLAHMNGLLYAFALSLMLIFYYEYINFKSIEKASADIYIEKNIAKHFCHELESVAIELKIRNRSKIGIPRIYIEEVLPRFLEIVDGKNRYMVSLPSESELVIKYKVKVKAPGIHPIGETRIILSDSLNFFVLTSMHNTKDSIVALPLALEVQKSFKSIRRLLGIKTLGKSIGGLYDLANIRDYVYGDDVRKILWKIYAKRGKLMIREDYGETQVKVLVLIDMRDYLWNIGSEPNTLAHIQLRLARSIIEALLKSRSIIDAAICGGAIPKIVRDLHASPLESMYQLFSVLEPGKGCEVTFLEYSRLYRYLGRDLLEYDEIILITNPISIALEDPKRIEELVSLSSNRLSIYIPRFNYEQFIKKTELTALLSAISRLLERGGRGLYIIDEDFSIIYKTREKS